MTGSSRLLLFRCAPTAHRSVARTGLIGFLLCLLFVPVWPAVSHAAEDTTLLHIRARSRLQLRQQEEQSRKGKFVVGVSVDLSDQPASSGEGDGAAPEDLHWFAGQRIELSLIGEAGLLGRVTLTTDRSGSASHSFARLPAGVYRLRAQYAGDEHRDPASADLDLHLDRSRSELSFSAPTTWEGGAALLVTGLSLRSKGRALPGPVTLAVLATRDGRVSGNALVQQLVRIDGAEAAAADDADQAWRDDAAPQPTSSRAGAPVKLHLPPVPAGSVLVVRASYAGDVDYSPAQSERELLVVTHARISLDPIPPEVAQSARLRIAGTLFTTGASGAGPLVGELVDIEATQVLEGPDSAGAQPASDGLANLPAARTLRRILGTAVSNADGRFVLDLPRLPLRAGPTDLVARVVPARRYIRPAVSNELRVVVTPPEPVSLLYFLLPLLGSALAAGLFLLGRLLAPRVLAWLAARRARKRAELVLSGAPPEAGEASVSTSGIGKIGSAGVSLDSRGALSLRRTIDNTIDGTVQDAGFGQALAGATISLTTLSADPAPQQRATESDGEGRFVLSQLRAGRCVIRVNAPGYQAQEFVATVPHRGEFRGITVRLLPLRVRLFAEWQRVAIAYYGEAGLVQTRTPQEFLRDAQSAPPAPAGRATAGLKTAVPAHVLPALRRLTTLVEEAYYSGRACNDAMVQESERLAAGLLPTAAAGKSSDGLRAESAPRPVQ